MGSRVVSKGTMSERHAAEVPLAALASCGARDADAACLRVALPTDVARARDAGDTAGAIDACRRHLAADPLPELAARLRLEWHRLVLAPASYRVPLDEVLAELQREAPGTTAEDVRALVERGLIDVRLIDSEPRALGSYLDVLRLYPDALPGLAPSPDDLSARREVRSEMARAGGASRRITVRASLSVTQAGPGDAVRIWLPVAADAPQQSRIEVLDCSPDGVLAPADAPARTCSWEGIGASARSVTYRYRVDAPYTDLWSEAGVAAARRAHAEAPLRAPAPTASDLAAEEPHLAFTPLVRAAARDVARCARRADPLELARAAYLFVTEHVSYRYQPPYIQLDAIPDYAIASGYGDCGVMALTFIALCRCLGVPARWQSGLYAAPSDIGAHDWAMFYTPDTGWLWADCSFGSGARRAGDEELRRFYFGNLDPWRTVCNRAFFAPFNPSCPGMRRDPFDNQMGEAACNGCGLPAGAIDQSVELVELEELPWKGRPA